MPIVKCTNKDGRTYAYLSTSYYDKEKKASRPKKKYLGRVDPETGEIIPPKGRRTSAQAEEAKKDPIAAAKKESEQLRRELLEANLKNEDDEITIRGLREEVVRLQSENSRLQKKLDLIHRETAPTES